MTPGESFSPYRTFTGVFIPDALVAFAGISAAEKICLARLYRYCGKTDLCWPSQTELAEELGVDIRSVQRYLKSLADAGFIAIEQPGLQESNRYRMLWHDVFSGPKSAFLTRQDCQVLTRQNCSGPDTTVLSGPDTASLSGPTYRTEESQREESHIQQIPSSTETPRPNEYEPLYPGDVIRGMNARKGKVLTPKQRSVVQAADLSELQDLKKAMEHFDRLFASGAHRRIGSGGSRYEQPAIQQKQAKPDPLAEMESDAGFAHFRQDYPGEDVIEADWIRAYPFWTPLTDAEREKAIEKVVDADPAFIKRPHNYLRDKEFNRPPRPEPKSDLDRLLERA